MRILIQHSIVKGYYCFSTSAQVSTDKNDGRSVDRETDIQSSHCRTRESFDDYFQAKEKAIKEEHRIQANDAAMQENDVDLNRHIMNKRDNMLWELKHQKENIKMHLPFLKREDDSPSPSAEQNEVNKSFTPAISIHLVKPDSTEAESSTSGQQNRFPQNSQDVSDDFPSSWEPFDD